MIEKTGTNKELGKIRKTEWKLQSLIYFISASYIGPTMIIIHVQRFKFFEKY